MNKRIKFLIEQLASEIIRVAKEENCDNPVSETLDPEIVAGYQDHFQIEDELTSEITRRLNQEVADGFK